MIALINISRPVDPDVVDAQYAVPVCTITGTWETKTAPFVQEYKPELPIWQLLQDHKIKSVLAEIVCEMPDGIDLWDWIELHTPASPERTAREMFASLPTDVQADCETDAKFHLDRPYNPWDAVQAWIESSDTLDCYIAYQALWDAGLVIASRTKPDGTTGEFMCRRIGK